MKCVFPIIAKFFDYGMNRCNLRYLKLEDSQHYSIGKMLIRGSSSAFFIKILAMAIAFGVQILLTRIMGINNYGVYVYVLSWLNVLAVFACFGMDVVLIKYVAAYNAQGNWGALNGILKRSNQIVFLSSVSISGVTALLILSMSHKLSLELKHTFLIACISLPFLALTTLRQAALQAQKRVILAHMPEAILRPILLSVVFVLLFVILKHINAFTTMILNSCVTIVSYSIGSFFLRTSLPSHVKTSSPNFQNREWLNLSMTMLLVSGMNLILNYSDTLIIGMFINTTEAGIYSIVTRYATFISFGLLSVNTIAAPMISEYSANRQKDQLQRLITMSSRGVFAFSIPVALIIIIWGKFFLGLFGTEFIQGYFALVILTIGYLINALSGSVGFLMTMTGHQREMALVITGSAILNIILNVLMIPIWGIQGAAFATSVSTISWNLILMYLVWKRLGLITFPIYFELKKV